MATTSVYREIFDKAAKNFETLIDKRLPKGGGFASGHGISGNYEEAIKGFEDCYVKSSLKDMDAAAQIKVLFGKRLDRLVADGVITEAVKSELEDASAQVEFAAYDEIMRLLTEKCGCKAVGRQ